MKKGFTLLIAILVSAVLLSIALAIFDLTTRQLELSTTAENSQLALFAADSGIECANYWDLQKQEFPYAVTDGPTNYKNYPNAAITCGNEAALQSIDDIYTSSNLNIATSTFDFYVPNGSTETYVEVQVAKLTDNNGNYETVIYSYGYNSGPNLADPNRTERALRESYGDSNL